MKLNKQLVIPSSFLILAALISALSSIWGNIATSYLPDFIKPLVPYSWYIFAAIVLLGIVVTIWQFLYQIHSNVPTPVAISSQQSNASSPSIATNQTSSTSSYPSCFICYSHHDQTFADKLYKDLQAKGVKCWYAPEDLGIGQKKRSTIEEAIQTHAKLLLILSEHSVSSAWVENEVETAFEEEQQQNTLILFPLRIDDSVMKTKQAWAATIRRTRWIGDFIQWQQQGEYERSLDRLFRDLRV